MITVGWKSVPIASLKLPGHWRQVLSDPAIPGFAKSFKVVGILHEPIVRETDKKLICGAHRVAAALHNGETEVLVKLVRCSDEEAETMKLVENLYRKHLTNDETHRLTDLLAQQIASMSLEEQQTILKPRKTGRMKLPRTVARELIAEAAGRTREAQRKAEQRHKKRMDEKEEQLDHNADLGINAPWADLDDDFKRRTNQVVNASWEIAKLVTATLRRMTMLLESGHPLHTARLVRLRDDLALLSKTMRGLVPSDLCPYCKGVPVLQEKCSGCAGTGYITHGQREGVPSELWETGDAAVVLTNGKFVPFSTFFEERPVPAIRMALPEAEPAEDWP